MSCARRTAVTLITRQLAGLLEAGIPLAQALLLLQPRDRAKSRRKPPRLALVLRDVTARIEQGATFAGALARHPEWFDVTFRRLIVLGEAAGRLAPVLTALARARDREEATRRRVRQALVYPAFVCGVAAAVLWAMLLWAVPAFAALFDTFNAQLPRPTRWLILFSQMLARVAPAVALALVFGTLLTAAALRRTPRLRCVLRGILQRIKYQLPLIGRLTAAMAMAQWASAIALLLEEGVPLADTLQMVADAQGDTLYGQASVRMATGVRHGDRLSRALEREPVFSPEVAGLIRIAEQTGNLTPILRDLADRTESDAQRHLTTLVTFIEPAVVTVCGGLVALLVMCLYLPIIELGNVL